MKIILAYFSGASGNFISKVIAHTILDSDEDIHVNKNGSCHYVKDNTCHSHEYTGKELVIRCHNHDNFKDITSKLTADKITYRVGKIVRSSQEERVCSALNQFTKHFCDIDMWDEKFIKLRSSYIKSILLPDNIFNEIMASADRKKYEGIAKYVYTTVSMRDDCPIQETVTLPFSAIMCNDANQLIQFVSELLCRELTATQKNRIAKWLSDYRAKQYPLWWDTPLQYYAEITQKFKEDIAKLNIKK